VSERGKAGLDTKLLLLPELCLHFVCYIKRCNKFFIKRNLEMLGKKSYGKRTRAIKNGCGQQGVTAEAKKMKERIKEPCTKVDEGKLKATAPSARTSCNKDLGDKFFKNLSTRKKTINPFKRSQTQNFLRENSFSIKDKWVHFRAT